MVVWRGEILSLVLWLCPWIEYYQGLDDFWNGKILFNCNICSLICYISSLIRQLLENHFLPSTYALQNDNPKNNFSNIYWQINIYLGTKGISNKGRWSSLVKIPPWHGGGRWFESDPAHLAVLCLISSVGLDCTLFSLPYLSLASNQFHKGTSDQVHYYLSWNIV